MQRDSFYTTYILLKRSILKATSALMLEETVLLSIPKINQTKTSKNTSIEGTQWKTASEYTLFKLGQIC